MLEGLEARAEKLRRKTMITLKQILVATDFSECSQVALAYGRALTRQFQARLHVMHVVETLEMGGYSADVPSVLADLEAEENARLAALITDDDRRELGADTTLATWQAPAHAVVEYATREHVDLIVVGTHGRRGLAHLVMGSVAEKIVRTAPCPVLTVRRPEREFVTADPASARVSA
jgi:nucleotide-binding universal stress UspA family protein